MRVAATIIILLSLVSCQSTDAPLPILGEPAIEGADTIYPRIADFSLLDQDSNRITNQTLAGKVYVADFIFLSCPTICPVMTKQLQQVYQHYAGDPRVVFLSHTIDPKHDSIPRLKKYATALGVPSARWHFVTGNKDSIYALSNQSYFSAAYPDSTSPGGFTHSGGLLLVDTNRHIRGVYNSSLPQETTRLINDIKILLKEQFDVVLRH